MAVGATNGKVIRLPRPLNPQSFGAPRSPRQPRLQQGHVVVLGGTGFIGSAITRRLMAHGADVTVVARRAPSDLEPFAGARVLQRDAADPDIYDDVLEGASAAVYSVGCLFPSESNADPLADVHSSLTPLIRLLEALRRRPEVPMVFLSSGGTVYGNPRTTPVTEDHPTDPTTSYGILKLTAEKYIGMYRDLYGLKTRILRVANAYGPGQLVGRGQGVVAAFIDKIVHGQPVTIFGTGRSVRDYIQVDDVARAVAASLTADGAHTVNIGTGIGTSLLQIVDLLESISGRSVEVDFQPARGFDVESIVLDVAPFRALMGSEPTDLATGLATAYEWASARVARPALALSEAMS